jgi:c-di-GMP-binding flagellar brake protein YcgR
MIEAGLAPKVNERAWLSFDDELQPLYPSRIEDVEAEYVLIAAPLMSNDSTSLTVLTAPEKTQKCLLIWNHSEAGYWKHSCYLAETQETPLALWKMFMVGRPEILQRRSFVRVPDDMQVTLHFSDRSVEARLQDISEGGISCTLTSFSVGVEHFPVYVDLIVGGRQVMIPSQVVRVEETTEDMELGVQFTQIENVHADLIRRHVFGRQLHLHNDGAA